MDAPRTSPPRALARAARDALMRLRFRAWVVRLRVALLRAGGRLRLEAPHGARFHAAPAIVALPTGEGDGVLTLRLGRDVDLGRSLTLEVQARGTNVLELGDGCRVEDGARLILQSGTLVAGAGSEIRDGARLKSGGELLLGRSTIISPYAIVHCAASVVLEDRVGLAESTGVLDSDHEVDGSGVYHQHAPLAVAPVRIGRNVLVGRGATLLRGATIGADSLVAANSVVNGGEYPPRSLLAGAPAKVVRRLGEDA